MTMRLVLLLALLPLPALAETLACQTAGYCTNALECHPDQSRFEIRIDKTGWATFGWVGSFVFSAQARDMLDMRVFAVASGIEATQTLILASNLQATYSVSSATSSGLYTSVQALTCERM